MDVEIEPNDVLQYLKQDSSTAEAPVTKKRKPRTTRKKKESAPEPAKEVSLEDKLREGGVDVQGSVESGSVEFNFSADNTFGEDTTQVKDIMLNAVARGAAVNVTQEDIINFQLSILDSKPIFLTIKVLLGCNIVFRSITPYEEDLIFEAVTTMVERDGCPAGLIPAYVQQFRLAMQLVSFHDRNTDYLSFKYEPGKRGDQIKQLIEYSMRITSEMPGQKYKLCVTAADVFEHKLAKLQSAALNETFWDPVSTD